MVLPSRFRFASLFKFKALLRWQRGQRKSGCGSLDKRANAPPVPVMGLFLRQAGFCIAMASAAWLGGCAMQGPLGFYAKALTPAQNEAMAEDTARQMAAMYPPASTYLSLQQPTQDPFGTALIDQLRGQGYALAEATTSRNQTQEAAKETAGTDFGYVVDKVGVDSYRVTATIGGETLSRIYLASTDHLSAIGYWVRRM